MSPLAGFGFDYSDQASEPGQEHAWQPCDKMRAGSPKSQRAKPIGGTRQALALSEARGQRATGLS